MIYTSVGNIISIIGFSVCLLYCLILIVFAIIKRIKAKKVIKAESKKARKEELKRETEKIDYKN